jgi:hypothetical protein
VPWQLAAMPPDFFLLAKPNESLKAQLDGLALRLKACEPEGFPHQFLIDYYIRAHDVYPSSWSYTL